jgi:phage gpG-like protein
MPARPYLGIDDRDREAIVEIVGDHLLKAVNGTGAPA